MQSSQPTAIVPFTILSVLTGLSFDFNSPDLYRIRLQPVHAAANGPTIKYLSAPNSCRTFTGPDAHHLRRNNLAFDRVPVGDWVVGRLVTAEEDVDGQGGKLLLASIETDTVGALNSLGMYSAEPVWCNTVVDEIDCQDAPDGPRSTIVVDAAGREIQIPTPPNIQCMDYVSASIVTAPAYVDKYARQVVLVSDWVPGHWVGIEREVRTHEIIQSRDPGLAPRFLAHITENHSRVIGFLLERIPNAREAGPTDLAKCRAALARLHALGIAMGQLRRHSFLVRDDGSVLIQGPFTGDLEDVGSNKEAMRAEMESLERVLAQSPSEYDD